MAADMMVMLPAVLLMNKIDFTDPTNLMMVQTAFVGVQVSILGFIALMYFKINGKADKRVIRVPPPPAFGQQAPPESQWESKTVQEYDLDKLRAYAQELILHTLIVGFIHYKFQLVPPLFLQSLMNPVRFYKNKLVQSHVFGWTGPELERPFKEDPPPLAGLLGGSQENAETPQEGADSAAPLDPPGTVREITEDESKEKKKPAQTEKKDKAAAKEEAKKTEAPPAKSAAIAQIDDIDLDETIENDAVPDDELLE